MLQLDKSIRSCINYLARLSKRTFLVPKKVRKSYRIKAWLLSLVGNAASLVPRQQQVCAVAASDDDATAVVAVVAVVVVGWQGLHTHSRSLPLSVTRFGGISPLMHNFKKCLAISWVINGGIWQNCEPTFANILYYLAIFHCSKWPNIEQMI